MLTSSIPNSATGLLIASSLKLTLLLAFATLLIFALRRRSAALRHQVWTTAVLASLLLPALILLLPARHSSALGPAAKALASGSSHASSAAVPASPAIIVNAAASSALGNRLTLAVLFLWALGVIAMLTRVVIGLVRLAWLRKHAEPLFDDAWMREVLNIGGGYKMFRAVRLLESRNPCAMPLTYGLFRPAILLPAGAAQWPTDRRRIVLSHELAHITRNDWFLQLGAELARALYWFHPLVWLAASQLRHESERACDDDVLNHGVPPSAYASQLLDLARTLKNPGRAWSTALAIARPTHLERRFAAMLNPSVNRNRPSVRTKLLVASLALALLLPLAALRLSAQSLSGKVAGTITDPSGAGVANATVIMHNHQAKTIDMTTSDRDGNFTFKSLPTGDYEFEVLKPGFESYDIPQITLDAARDFSQAVMLKLGAVNERVQVTPGNSATPVERSADGKVQRIRLGGTVEAAQLVTKVTPVYPESAKSAGVQGTVVLHAVISMDGRPLSLRVMNSQIDPALAKSAVEAVSQWRYTPTLLNGDPIEVDTTIQVNYSLQP
jgi:TonB family protein